MINVFIDGSAGTTGLRIAERLSSRSDVNLLHIDEKDRKDADARKKLLNAADIAFLCLPDAAAVEAVALVENPNTCVIDASTAHRVAAGWAYGFPELSPAHRTGIKSLKRVSVPGCHASGFVALCYPLVAEGLMPPDFPATCHSVTGYSGGGKQMIAQYEASEREQEFSSPRQYALSQAHKHLKEMRTVSGLDSAPVFSPIVADYYAGMVVTVPIHARLLKGAPTLNDIRAVYADRYAGSPIVRVMPAGSESAMMGANNLAGKDYMEIFVTGDDARALVIARFDNLGKGASGAAVQCMNIHMGVDETTGLSL